MMATPVDVMKCGLAKVHDSEEFSDCKIICGPYHFNVHKVILATQSVYFKSAFKSGTFKEGESGTIELKAIGEDAELSEEDFDVCDDPDIVKLMIEYFYHFDYLRDVSLTPNTKPKKKKKRANDTVPLFSSPTEPQVYIIEHAKVFAMAIKYQIDGLRDLAIEKFKEAVKTQWSHGDFPHTVSIVYSTTADHVHQLRQIVSDTLHERLDNLKDKEEIEFVVCSIPGLAYDLMKRSREPLRQTSCVNGHGAKGAARECHQCHEVYFPCSGCTSLGYSMKCPNCGSY